jgi:hypothetical protein
MKLGIPLMVSFALLSAASQASQVLREVSWSQVQSEGRLSSGKAESVQGGPVAECLRIENASGQAATFPLYVFENPGVTHSQYAVQGKIRCESVEGKGYLESWNWFGGEERYFSRTLGDSGPMKSIGGTSEWRDFSLPFSIGAEKKRPSKIEVNLVLPGKGVVCVGPIQLVEFEGKENSLTGLSEWWSGQQGGWVGAFIGCLGGLFGCLGGVAGSLAYRGKARGLAFGVLYVMATLGGFSLVAGLTALALSQPYHVYYPLLLAGVLFFVLGLGLIPTMRKRYEQAELHRMKAMDTA